MQAMKLMNLDMRKNVAILYHEIDDEDQGYLGFSKQGIDGRILSSIDIFMSLEQVVIYSLHSLYYVAMGVYMLVKGLFQLLGAGLLYILSQILRFDDTWKVSFQADAKKLYRNGKESLAAELQVGLGFLMTLFEAGKYIGRMTGSTIGLFSPEVGRQTRAAIPFERELMQYDTE